MTSLGIDPHAIPGEPTGTESGPFPGPRIGRRHPGPVSIRVRNRRFCQGGGHLTRDRSGAQLAAVRYARLRRRCGPLGWWARVPIIPRGRSSMRSGFAPGAVLVLALISLVSGRGTEGADLAGLVASYPFDGNAMDASGLGNHGVVRGAVLAADRFGVPDRAYRFTPGVDWGYANPNYIEIANLAVPLSGDFTISYWAQSTSPSRMIALGVGDV